MANGKLNVELTNDYVGEFSKLKDALLNISKFKFYQKEYTSSNIEIENEDNNITKSTENNNEENNIKTNPKRNEYCDCYDKYCT